jgi:hypothetical protein
VLSAGQVSHEGRVFARGANMGGIDIHSVPATVIGHGNQEEDIEADEATGQQFWKGMKGYSGQYRRDESP